MSEPAVPPRAGLFSHLRRVRNVFLGSSAYIGLGFLAHVLIANALSPSDFGRLAVALAVMVVLQEVAGSGVDEAMVRFAARSRGADDHRARTVMGGAFALKLTANTAVAAMLWAFAHPLSLFFWSSPVMVDPLRWAAAAIVGSAVHSFMLSVFQAREEFGRYALNRPLAHVVKVVALVALWHLNRLDLTAALVVSAISPFVASALAMLFLRRAWVPVPAVSAQVPWRGLVEFAGFLVLSKLMFALYSRIDVLALEYFRPSAEVGAYAIAGNLIFLIDLATFSVIVSMLPEASRIGDRDSALRYARSTMMQCLVLAVLLLPMFIVVDPLVGMLYRHDYSGAVSLFRILFWGSLATLLVHPLYLLLYARNRPGLLAAVNFVQVLITATGCLVLVPALGGVGAAYSSLVARVTGCLLILYVVVQQLPAVRPHGVAIPRGAATGETS
jgi:O-antigen/teichoic acid export membrane protein